MKIGNRLASIVFSTSFAAILIVTAIIAGCAAPVPQAPATKAPPTKEQALNLLACSIDEDCICEGIDKKTGNCFIGNKQYYEKYVDKSKNCPDFCGGIAGNLVIKCVNSQCLQTLGCVLDTECNEGQSCVNNKCVTSKTALDGSSTTDACRTDADCMTGGCSGTICQSKKAEPVVTTCEYRPEYSCYKQISCGCSAGQCAWKETQQFRACIAQAKTQEGEEFPV
ncbi:eight-cysteine-cluster domain-containing protein [Candidatus Woesearchaeota archaeon]|nr:eight-cysteine-cluster domain-containing protein [Candidatus Woesearchaeota archaeon]